MAGRRLLGCGVDPHRGGEELFTQLTCAAVKEPALYIWGVRHRFKPCTMAKGSDQGEVATGSQDAVNLVQDHHRLVLRHMQQRGAAPDPIETRGRQRDRSQVSLHHAARQRLVRDRQHRGRSVDSGDPMAVRRERCPVECGTAPKVGKIGGRGQPGSESLPQIRE